MFSTLLLPLVRIRWGWKLLCKYVWDDIHSYHPILEERKEVSHPSGIEKNYAEFSLTGGNVLVTLIRRYFTLGVQFFSRPIYLEKNKIRDGRDKYGLLEVLFQAWEFPPKRFPARMRVIRYEIRRMQSAGKMYICTCTVNQSVSQSVMHGQRVNYSMYITYILRTKNIYYSCGLFLMWRLLYFARGDGGWAVGGGEKSK